MHPGFIQQQQQQQQPGNPKYNQGDTWAKFAAQLAQDAAQPGVVSARSLPHTGPPTPARPSPQNSPTHHCVQLRALQDSHLAFRQSLQSACQNHCCRLTRCTPWKFRAIGCTRSSCFPCRCRPCESHCKERDQNGV